MLVRATGLLVLICFCLVSKAQLACPVNFDTDSLQAARNHLSEWDGKIISFNALIQRVDTLSQNVPYVLVKLTGGEHCG